MSPYFAMFEDQPHFALDHTPDGWPKDLTPPAPATLLGGVTFGPLLSTVYRYPRRVDASAAYQRVLARAGFTRGSPVGRPRGGFTSQKSAEGTTWCRRDGHASVMVVDSTATTRSLLVTFASSLTSSSPSCNASAAETGWKPPLAIPALTAPLGVSARAAGSAWGGEYLSTSVSVDTTMSTDSLLGHYVRQLVAAGWQAGKLLSDGSTALQSVSVRDPDGKRWVGALTLVTAADRRTIVLNMMRAVREQQ